MNSSTAGNRRNNLCVIRRGHQQIGMIWRSDGTTGRTMFAQILVALTCAGCRGRSRPSHCLESPRMDQFASHLRYGQAAGRGRSRRAPRTWRRRRRTPSCSRRGALASRVDAADSTKPRRTRRAASRALTTASPRCRAAPLGDRPPAGRDAGPDRATDERGQRFHSRTTRDRWCSSTSGDSVALPRMLPAEKAWSEKLRPVAVRRPVAKSRRSADNGITGVGGRG